MSYRRGDFYRIDDRTGFKRRASETQKEWDGFVVAKDVWEPRHPQEFVRTKGDKQSVPDARPRPPDQFVGTEPSILVQDIGDGPCLLVAYHFEEPSFELIPYVNAEPDL